MFFGGGGASHSTCGCGSQTAGKLLLRPVHAHALLLTPCCSRPAAAAARLQLGISAPQGCGKSTLVEQLEQLCAWLGVSAASVSIDDFYLTNAQQNALAAANPDNRLLGVRGNAGSHDLALGRDTVQQLKACSSTDSVVAVPRWVGSRVWALWPGCCGCGCAWLVATQKGLAGGWQIEGNKLMNCYMPWHIPNTADLWPIRATVVNTGGVIM